MEGSRYQAAVDPFRTSEIEQETPFRIHYLHGEAPEPGLTPETVPESLSPFRTQLVRGESADAIPKELEFEVFASETADPEFQDMLSEIVTEGEALFAAEAGTEGPQWAMEAPDSMSRFDQFFAHHYEPLAQEIEQNFERFASHLETRIGDNSDLEAVHQAIDSFEPIEPEQFFGKIRKWIRKAGRGLKAVAGKALKTIGKIVPLHLILRKLKSVIRPLLKRLLAAGLKFLPPQYRELARKALESILGIRKPEADTTVVAPDVGEELPADIGSEARTDSEVDEEVEGEAVSALSAPPVDAVERELDQSLFYIAQGLMGRAQGPPSLAEAEPIRGAESEAIVVDRARRDYVRGLMDPGADIERLTEGFLPIVLKAVSFGIKIVGRKRVIRFLSRAVARLIEPIVGKELSGPLSNAVVDAGLRLIGAETAEPVDRGELLSRIVANTVAESAARVAGLPESILDGEDEVLEAHVEEAVLDAIGNNFPSAVLTPEVISARTVPEGTDWVPVDAGEYKVLSGPINVTLDPDTAATVRTLHQGETLDELLADQQDWNLEGPENFTVRLYEVLPQTSLSTIAKRYVGGAEPRDVAQIIPLTHRAADALLNNPDIYVPARSGVRRYYSITRRGVGQRGQASAPRARFALRYLEPNTIEIRFFIGERTARRIRKFLRAKLTTQLLKRFQRTLVSAGSFELRKLLVRLKIPDVIARPFASWLLSWFARHLNRLAAQLRSKFSAAVEKPAQGVTVVAALQLPFKLTELPFLGLPGLPRLLSGTPNATLDVLPGRRL